MNNEEINSLSHAYWSGRAEEFSALRMAEYETSMREAMLEMLRSLLPQREVIHALDVGCGAGFLTLLLCELGCEVTAVDFSAEMLEQASKNCREKGFDCASFLQMDAQKLAFADETFDFVITRNVIWIVPDAESVYRGMLRVLTPGGVLLNLDANYGRTFNEADARGEIPVHPTQTQEQLRMRNRIARELDVTKADRPQWDFDVLWSCGASEIRCLRNLRHQLGDNSFNPASVQASAQSSSEMFAVIAAK